MLLTLASAAAMVSCGQKSAKDGDENFRYLIDQFADIKIMIYRIPGWEDLSLRQKEYIYHLSEAAKYGWDIHWDQNCRYNLDVRKVLQDIIEKYDGDRNCRDYADFLVYAKRVYFKKGRHDA